MEYPEGIMRETIISLRRDDVGFFVMSPCFLTVNFHRRRDMLFLCKGTEA